MAAQVVSRHVDVRSKSISHDWTHDIHYITIHGQGQAYNFCVQIYRLSCSQR